MMGRTLGQYLASWVRLGTPLHTVRAQRLPDGGGVRFTIVPKAVDVEPVTFRVVGNCVLPEPTETDGEPKP